MGLVPTAAACRQLFSALIGPHLHGDGCPQTQLSQSLLLLPQPHFQSPDHVVMTGVALLVPVRTIGMAAMGCSSGMRGLCG